jgi:hypothetical protein
MGPVSPTCRSQGLEEAATRVRVAVGEELPMLGAVPGA